MTEQAAYRSCLKRGRSYLQTWSRSVDNMISEAQKDTSTYWSLHHEKEMLKKQISRLNRKLRRS